MPTFVDPLRLQPLDDGDLVLGLAEPAAVVVERQRAADLRASSASGRSLATAALDPPLLLGAR